MRTRPLRRIEAADLPALARGCSVLGAGGGGDPYIPLLAARQALEEHGPVEVVAVADLPGDALLMPCGMVGAPSVGIEKIGAVDEPQRLLEGVEAVYGRPVAALAASEIGGANGLMPVGWAARLGLPLADADGMGRAFPRMTQTSMELAGIPAIGVLCDEHGNTIEFHPAASEWLERAGRAAVDAFGGRGSSCEYPLTAAEAITGCLHGAYAHALALGRALEDADDPIEQLEADLGARRILTGKIVDLDSQVRGGFTFGSAAVEGTGADGGSRVTVEFQNENLLARRGDAVVAAVPDIIAMLDAESGEALHTERLRYGQRVTVLVLPAPEVWNSPAGLALAGPRAFGYDFDRGVAS